MCVNYFLIALIGFLLGIICLNILKKLSLKLNFLIPKGMPVCGGLGISAVFILVSSLVLSFLHVFSKEIAGIIVSSGLMLIFGVIDDYRELSVPAKFIVQLIAVSLLIAFGVKTQLIYIGSFLNTVITFFWILGITNAFNHLDVMDGVSAGVTIIVSFTFFIICLANNDIKTAVLCIALTGVVTSFFLYNLPPARMYMGNAGSHFLGFLLSAIALVISYASLERKVALLSPILILGFPILDSLLLILVRLKKGRSIFKKSDDHLALQFLKFGYSKNKALFLMLIYCALLSLSGLVVALAPNPWGVVAIIAAFAISIAFAKTGKVFVYG